MRPTTATPPPIKQYFSHILLSYPAKLHDDLEVLGRIYFYIKKRLIKKAKYNPKWQAECEQLETRFLQLYECAKKKEQDAKTEAKNQTQKPFYRIRFPDRSHGDLFDRFRYKYFTKCGFFFDGRVYK